MCTRTLNLLKELETDEVDQHHSLSLEAKHALLIHDHDQYEKRSKKAIKFFAQNSLYKEARDLAKSLSDYYFRRKKYKDAYQYLTIAYEQQQLLGGQMNENH